MWSVVMWLRKHWVVACVVFAIFTPVSGQASAVGDPELSHLKPFLLAAWDLAEAGQAEEALNRLATRLEPGEMLVPYVMARILVRKIDRTPAELERARVTRPVSAQRFRRGIPVLVSPIRNPTLVSC
jgi:hypothetical protein